MSHYVHIHRGKRCLGVLGSYPSKDAAIADGTALSHTATQGTKFYYMTAGSCAVHKRTRRNPEGKKRQQKKTKVIRTFTMDFTAQIEWAKRADGQWFKRIQGRDPRYGYKWGAWKAVPTPAAEIAQKHGEMRAIRLPKSNPGRLRTAAGLARRGDVAGLVRGGAALSAADAKKWTDIASGLVSDSVRASRGAIRAGKKAKREIDEAMGEATNPSGERFNALTSAMHDRLAAGHTLTATWLFGHPAYKAADVNAKKWARTYVAEIKAPKRKKNTRAATKGKVSPDFEARYKETQDWLAKMRPKAKASEKEWAENPRRGPRVTVWKFVYQTDPDDRMVVAKVGDRFYLVAPTKAAKLSAGAKRNAAIYAKQLGLVADSFAIKRRSAVVLKLAPW